MRKISPLLSSVPVDPAPVLRLRRKPLSAPKKFRRALSSSHHKSKLRFTDTPVNFSETWPPGAAAHLLWYFRRFMAQSFAPPTHPARALAFLIDYLAVSGLYIALST